MSVAGGLQLRIMLVEDHGVLRDILRDFIHRLPQVESCTASPSAESALATLGAGDNGLPDLMLIDLSLPGMNGIELIRTLKQAYPRLACAILSGHRSRAYARQALDAGASGYLLKGDPLEIERGISAIFQGDRYVTSTLRE